MHHPTFTIRILKLATLGCGVFVPVFAQQLDDPSAQIQPNPEEIGQQMLQIQPAIIPFNIQPAELVDPFSVPANEPFYQEPPVPSALEDFTDIGLPGEIPAPEVTKLEDAAEFPESDFNAPELPQQALSFSNFTTPGFSSPSGFESSSGWMSNGAMLGDSVRDGLNLSAAMSGSYSSNPSQGFGAEEDAGQGDFFMNVGGSASYRTQAATVNYLLSYSGGYNQYFSQSDLSGYNQSAGAGMTYESGPLSVGLQIGLDLGSGANRRYGAIVDETRFGVGVNASYRYSPKTSFSASFSTGITSASGGEISDTGSYAFGASALWRYSPLTEFGPGVRYSISSGDADGDRTSIGPTLTCNYQVSRKISLNSMVGADFASYEGGESKDPSLFTNIGLSYRASEIWGLTFSLSRDAQPSLLNPGEFDETTAMRIGYSRRIRRVNWQLGFGYENSSALENDGSASSQADREYFSANTSLAMPIFANSTSVSLNFNISDQSGGDDGSWNAYQVGIGISRNF